MSKLMSCTLCCIILYVAILAVLLQRGQGKVKLTIDTQRTGVKALQSDWANPFIKCIDGRWNAPPGTMILCHDIDGSSYFIIACPSCGEMGAPRYGVKWTAIEGSQNDVTTLTLSPSILKSCCGWHGYLVRGIFQLSPNIDGSQ